MYDVWWCMVVHGGVWWRLTTLFAAAIFIFMIMFINQISMVVYGGVRWCTLVYGGVWWCTE